MSGNLKLELTGTLVADSARLDQRTGCHTLDLKPERRPLRRRSLACHLTFESFEPQRYWRHSPNRRRGEVTHRQARVEPSREPLLDPRAPASPRAEAPDTQAAEASHPCGNRQRDAW